MEAEESKNTDIQERDETGSTVGEAAGGAAGEAIGSAYAGPIGGYIGKVIGEKVGSWLGDKAEDAVTDEKKDDEEEKKKGGSCGGGSGSNAYQAADKQCHKTPKTPRYKLEIEENKVPENWWDKLPDFDPKVYDAIAMEQAAACVKYIFDQLPEMHELEHQMEARKNRQTCPRLKTQVPRTKVIKPKEIKYETTIDTFIKKD